MRFIPDNEVTPETKPTHYILPDGTLMTVEDYNKECERLTKLEEEKKAKAKAKAQQEKVKAKKLTLDDVNLGLPKTKGPPSELNKKKVAETLLSRNDFRL